MKYEEKEEATCRVSLTVWYCAKRQRSISNFSKGSRSRITGVSVTCDCSGDALCLADAEQSDGSCLRNSVSAALGALSRTESRLLGEGGAAVTA